MNLISTIGNTPLIKLERVSKDLKANIYAKCEFLNPAGSIKDRVALSMVEDALNSGVLNSMHIVEATSGNTGIGLALVCALKGIKLTIVMPESMSKERRDIIKHFGAELILTDAKDGMQGSIDKALEISKAGAVMLNQFENPSNPKIHYQTTAPEIIKDIEDIDIFIAGVGTGGTISGVGKFLKERSPNCTIVAVEPSESAVIGGKQKGLHKIEGIGAGFIPKNLDLNVVDKTIEIKSEDAIAMAKELSKREALFVGVSSGANVAAIYKLAKSENLEGKTVITILPDTASRYQSTDLFS